MQVLTRQRCNDCEGVGCINCNNTGVIEQWMLLADLTGVISDRVKARANTPIKGNVTVDRIIEAVSKVNGVRIESITSSTKSSKEVTDARHQAIALVRYIYGLSYNRSGRIVNGCDMSTSKYACGTFYTNYHIDNKYHRKVQDVCKLLNIETPAIV